MAKRAKSNNPPPQDRLVSLIDRIERLLEDRGAINEDIKDVYSEAKSAGFNTKIMRNVIRIRQIEPDTFEEEMAATNTYLRALGMPEVDISAAADL